MPTGHLLFDSEAASDFELLAAVARTDPPERLLGMVATCGGLEGLADLGAWELEGHLTEAGIPKARASAAALAASVELGRRLAARRARPRDQLVATADVAKWAQAKLGGLRHEELWLLALDGSSRLRACRRVAQGGSHGMSIHAPDVLRAALRLDATGFVLVHNHPSGDCAPSREDVVFTRAVATGAAVIGMPLLDHVIVSVSAFAIVPLDEG